MLYSHRQATPAPLPHRIRFADGSTRTDRATFTPDELERAGLRLQDREGGLGRRGA